MGLPRSGVAAALSRRTTRSRFRSFIFRRNAACVSIEDGDAGASSGYILRAGSTRKGILCRAGPVRHTVKRNGGASGSQTSMRTWST